MGKVFRHLLTVTMILSLSLFVIPMFSIDNTVIKDTVHVYADEGDIAGGLYLDVVPWRITSDHTLLFGEEGKAYTITAEYNYHHVFPWREYKDSIKSAKILGKISAVGNLDFMFSEYSYLTSVDLKGLDTSRVTNMCYMFEGCSSLKELNLSTFDTGKAEYMNCMFEGCSSLASLNLSSFKTGRVTDMSEMFKDCSSLNELDLGSFDTGEVENIAGMFENCSSLKSLDLSNFNTRNVDGELGMISVFSGCSNLTSLNVSSFDTSDKDISFMFNNCKKLESLDISSFDTSGSSDLSYMFDGCRSLKKLKLGSGWSYAKAGKYNIPEVPVNMIGDNNTYYAKGSDVPGKGVRVLKASKKLPLKKLVITDVKGSSGGFTVKWPKASSADQKQFNGYQIQYSTKKSFSGGVKTVTASKSKYHKFYSGNRLKRNTTYYVRVRRFKKSGGKKIYALWSYTESVKTK